MAKETVAALYTKLGLDLSDLDRDFAMADKTVNQAISRLNHESKKIKINTDTDLTKITGARAAVQELALKEQALTKQLDLQRQKISLVTAAYKEMTAAKGADSAASAKLETRLLNERRAYASLESQLREVRRAREQNGTANRMLNSVISGASAASVLSQGAMDLGALSLISSPAGKAAGAALAIGGGVVAMAKQAMDAGNSVYQLAQKMHTTTAEAAKMNIAFRLAGADVNAAIPAIVRLDKAVESAGDTGNQTTAILDAFGVNLRDASGNLLPVTQQLAALAEGYKAAAAAGLESEYTAQVLGSRGAELVPVLSQMADIQDRVARIPTTGLLNPEKAHEMALDWQEMKIAAGQLSGALGAAFMPVVADVLPDVSDGVESLVKAIRDNKDDITDFVATVGSVGGVAVDACKLAAGAFNDLGVNVENAGTLVNFTKGVISDFGNTWKSIKDTFGNTAIGAAVGNLWDWAMEDYRPKKKAEEKNKTEKDDSSDFDVDSIKDAYKEALEKAKEKTVATAPDISVDLYKATHSDLENQLFDIDRRAEKLRAEGVAEEEIVKLTEAQKSKVYKGFNDNTIAQINRAWRSELDNRLSDIEREKEAWRKKGVDEVTATRWAEREKSKAMQESARTIAEQSKAAQKNGQNDYLEIVRGAIASGGSDEAIQAKARKAILSAMRENEGLEDFKMNARELSVYSDAMTAARNNLIRGLEVDSWAMPKTAAPAEVRGGMSYTPPSPQVTVNIDGGIYTDERGMAEMADKVADKIKPLFDNAMRSSELSYET